jgi:hypothetical protein
LLALGGDAGRNTRTTIWTGERPSNINVRNEHKIWLNVFGFATICATYYNNAAPACAVNF